MCYGLYAQMGMLDCVANSWQEYIELALRMAHDLPWREAMRQKVLELSEPIFEDRAVMLGLAQVIERLDKR
jgi:predicted O-linked N-acetylglucosamine transferase (SPINDLY family)